MRVSLTLALVPKEPERSLSVPGSAKREKTASNFIVAKLVWTNRPSQAGLRADYSIENSPQPGSRLQVRVVMW